MVIVILAPSDRRLYVTVTAPPRSPRDPVDPADRDELRALIEALFEEARARKRRRRRMYWAVAFSLLGLGALVFTAPDRPASPQTASQALPDRPGLSADLVSSGEHIYAGVFRLEGKSGNLTVVLRFGSSGTRNWSVVPSFPSPRLGGARAGQYAQMVGGGRHIEAGGHASAWHARIVGFVTSKGRARQHVIIKLMGRPNGTFALTPTQPGAVKPDSGTQRSGWMG
jgi:hypothetical protein